MSLLTEFEPVITVDGGLPSIYTGRQADSQTFTQGQGVRAIDNGLVEEAASQETILGIASVDGKNNTDNDKFGIWLNDHRTIFLATCTTPGNLTVARIYDQVEHDENAGVHTINEDAVTEAAWMIVDITAVGGRAYVKSGGAGIAGSGWGGEDVYNVDAA